MTEKEERRAAARAAIVADGEGFRWNAGTKAVGPCLTETIEDAVGEHVRGMTEYLRKMDGGQAVMDTLLEELEAREPDTVAAMRGTYEPSGDPMEDAEALIGYCLEQGGHMRKAYEAGIDAIVSGGT